MEKNCKENEYEWRISELPSADNELTRLIKKMNKYSNLPWPYNKRAEILKHLVKKRLSNVDKLDFQFGFKVLFGNLYGDSVWFSNTDILDYAPIYFGNHITIGPDVKLITSWHSTENFNIVKASPISIGNNVWITMNTIVLPGVTIGENCIIGTGSVVTKSIPANTFAAGNPARPIKEIDRNYNWWLELDKDILFKNSKRKSPYSFLPQYIKEPIKKMFFYFR